MQATQSKFLTIFLILFVSGCQDSSINADKGDTSPYKDYPFRALSYFRFDMSEKAFKLDKGEQKKLANATLAYHLGKLQSQAFKDTLLNSLDGKEKGLLAKHAPNAEASPPTIGDLVIFETRVRDTSSYLSPALEIIAYSKTNQRSCSLVLNKILDLYPGFVGQSGDNIPGIQNKAAFDQLLIDIQVLEQKQQAFRKGHNIVNFDVAKASIVTEVNAVKDVQLGNNIERRQILALLGQIHTALKSGQDPAEIDEVRNYGKISIFQSRVSELETKQSLTEEGTQVWNTLQEEKEDIEEQIFSEIETSIRIMKEKILTLDTMEEQIQKELKQLNSGIRKLEELEVEDKILTNSIKEKNDQLDQLVNGKDAKGGHMRGIPTIKIEPGPKSVPPEVAPEDKVEKEPTLPGPRP